MLILGISATNTIGNGVRETTDETMLVIESLEDMRFTGQQIVLSAAEYALNRAQQEAAGGSGPGERGGKGEAEAEADVESAIEAYYRAFNRYQNLIIEHSPDEMELLEKIGKTGPALLEASVKLIESRNQGAVGPEALEKAEEFEKRERAFSDAVGAALAYEREEHADRERQLASAAGVAVWAISAVGAVTFAVAIAIGLLMSRSITVPINRLKRMAEAISQGNLDAESHKISGKDEIGQLAVTFDEMAGKLRDSYGGLERRVKERTLELEEAKNTLEQEVAERKRAQEELRELAANLERSNRALQHFASVSSHDLQEPLRKARAFGDQLKPGFGDVLADFWLPTMANKLRDSNEGLERRVQERTLELEEAKSILEEEVAVRKRAEEELRTLAANLERSNRELQHFASIASHDLQEPLRKIQAFGDRLKAGFGEVLADKGQDYLARMLNAAERMQTLINDLLTFSRLTTRAEPFVPVDLAVVTEQVLVDLEVTVEQAGGCVEVSGLPTIDAEPTQMRQLLQNLVSNSLKFRKQEEPPIVKIRGQILDGPAINGGSGSASRSLLRLTVEDNGIGFDERHCDRIFGVFQRLHGRGEYPGTGIGLAVCRKIADRHDGSITVKSQPGQGATFVVTLPLEQPKGENPEWAKTADLLRS